MAADNQGLTYVFRIINLGGGENGLGEEDYLRNIFLTGRILRKR